MVIFAANKVCLLSFSCYFRSTEYTSHEKNCFSENINALKSSLRILTRSQKQQRCFFIYVNIITTARSYK